MRSLINALIFLITLTACSAIPAQQGATPLATDSYQSAISNPASLYSEQNGGKLEIHTAADGSLSGVSVFPDGRTCDEWAYFRGKCGFGVQANSTPANPVAPTQKTSFDATEEHASGGDMPPDVTEKISNWWGIIKSTPSGAQYDDYFERQDLGQNLYFGIDSMEPTVKSQIEAIRDSGKKVHLYGTLLSNVPDYNGSQIQVDRIEVEE